MILNRSLHKEERTELKVDMGRQKDAWMELYGNSVLNNTLQVLRDIKVHILFEQSIDFFQYQERIEQHQLKKSQSAVWSHGYSRAGQPETVEHGDICLLSSCKLFCFRPCHVHGQAGEAKAPPQPARVNSDEVQSSERPKHRQPSEKKCQRGFLSNSPRLRWGKPTVQSEEELLDERPAAKKPRRSELLVASASTTGPKSTESGF